MKPTLTIYQINLINLIALLDWLLTTTVKHCKRLFFSWKTSENQLVLMVQQEKIQWLSMWHWNPSFFDNGSNLSSWHRVIISFLHQIIAWSYFLKIWYHYMALSANKTRAEMAKLSGLRWWRLMMGSTKGRGTADTNLTGVPIQLATSGTLRMKHLDTKWEFWRLPVVLEIDKVLQTYIHIYHIYIYHIYTIYTLTL